MLNRPVCSVLSASHGQFTLKARFLLQPTSQPLGNLLGAGSSLGRTVECEERSFLAQAGPGCPSVTAGIAGVQQCQPSVQLPLPKGTVRSTRPSLNGHF